ncbi:MAG: RdgB/HAM1 family non-canonical purine NTP pyrophosphatase [Phycisphaerae bacterium]|jgi:XTP/dITP diphosphohydrolase
MLRSIVLATRNPGKIREIRSVLADLPLSIRGLEALPDLAEPEETGSSFAENARQKAIYYALATAGPCLADDSGLEVDALGGEPGVRSARYAADRCPSGASRREIDQANNALLLERLADVPPHRRTARFVCHLALAEGQQILLEACDTLEGQIGYEPRGDNGFGYDPLFIYPPARCTTAELDESDKNLVSHRGKALRHFAQRLQKFLQQGS